MVWCVSVGKNQKEFKEKETDYNNKKEEYFMPRIEEIIISGFVGGLLGKIVLEPTLAYYLHIEFTNPTIVILIGIIIGLIYVYRNSIKNAIFRIFK